jgi:hypothetical protein
MIMEQMLWFEFRKLFELEGFSLADASFSQEYGHGCQHVRNWSILLFSPPTMRVYDYENFCN